MNPVFEAYDKASKLNSIIDAKKIIIDFNNRGYLDRDKAIQKILEIKSDKDIALELEKISKKIPYTHAKLLVQATDVEIIDELKFLIAIIYKKIEEKE